ncbi:MAG: sec-independent protein translocase protein TatB [Gallionellaceae bacterium]|nr:MAG: sec-independent protein translocase protein TatB [Gallionellaceae bacterium]
MFDVAFSELVVVALVALIVVGPERLPQVARTAGHMWGRLQRYVSTVKNDISNEMDLEAASKMKRDFVQQVGEVEQEVKAAQLTLEQQILQAQYSQSPPIDPIEVSPHNDVKNNPQ